MKASSPKDAKSGDSSEHQTPRINADEEESRRHAAEEALTRGFEMRGVDPLGFGEATQALTSMEAGARALGLVEPHSTLIPTVLLVPRRSELVDGTNLRFDRMDPLNGRMPWFPDAREESRSDPVKPVIPRPGTMMSTDPWLRISSTCSLCTGNDVQQLARIPLEAQKALLLLGLVPPGVVFHGREADNWILPVPKTQDEVRSVRDAVMDRERERISFALSAYVDQLYEMNFRFVDEETARGADPALWSTLRPYVHSGWALAPTVRTDPDADVVVRISQPPTVHELKMTVDGQLRLARSTHLYRTEWSRWGARMRQAAQVVAEHFDARNRVLEYFTELGRTCAMPNPKQSLPASAPSDSASDVNSLSGSAEWGDETVRLPSREEIEARLQAERSLILSMREKGTLSLAAATSQLTLVTDRAAQALSRAISADFVTVRPGRQVVDTTMSPSEFQPVSAVRAAPVAPQGTVSQVVQGQSGVGIAKASTGVDTGARFEQPRKLADIVPQKKIADIVPVSTQPAQVNWVAQRRKNGQPAPSVERSPSDVSDDVGVGGPARRPGGRRDEAPYRGFDPWDMAEALPRQVGTTVALGQTLGRLVASQPTPSATSSGFYRLVPTFQPQEQFKDTWLMLHQALVFATTADGRSEPDLMYFPPRGTPFDEAIYDPLLYWSIDRVRGVGDVIRLRPQWEVAPNAFIGPHRGVIRTVVPEVTTYVVQHEFPVGLLTRDVMGSSSRRPAATCTVYLDDVWRTGIGAYVCSPRGMWFRTTGAGTPDDIERRRNVDVCHWSERVAGETYLPCTPNCSFSWIEGPQGIRVPGITVGDSALRGSADQNGLGPILMADYEPPVVRLNSSLVRRVRAADDESYMGTQLQMLNLTPQEMASCQDRSQLPMETCERLVKFIAERLAEYQETHFMVPLVNPPVDENGRADCVGAVATREYHALMHRHGVSLAARQRQKLPTTDGVMMRNVVSLAQRVTDGSWPALDAVQLGITRDPQSSLSQTWRSLGPNQLTPADVDDVLEWYATAAEDDSMLGVDIDSYASDETPQASEAASQLRTPNAAAVVYPQLMGSTQYVQTPAVQRRSPVQFASAQSLPMAPPLPASVRLVTGVATARDAGPVLRGYSETPRTTALAALQNSTDHLASDSGPALRQIVMNRQMDLSGAVSDVVSEWPDLAAQRSGEATTTYDSGGVNPTHSMDDRKRASWAARGYIIADGVKRLVPLLHERYCVTIPSVVSAAVGQIQQCYTYDPSPNSRYGNEKFNPGWWNHNEPRTRPTLTMLEYLSKLNAAALLANVRYHIILSYLISGEHILRPGSDELTTWRGACDTARYDFNLMFKWSTEVSELQGRIQALIVFLYRHLAIVFHKETPRYRIVTELLGLRLLNNNARNLRVMYVTAMALYHQLSPLDRDLPELQSMTKLMLHNLGLGPVNGSHEDKKAARSIQSYLSDTIKSIKVEDGTPDVTGAALDSVLNRAITECAGQNPNAAVPGNMVVSDQTEAVTTAAGPARPSSNNRKDRRDRRKQKERRSDSPATINAVAVTDEWIQNGATGAPKVKRHKVNAVRQQSSRYTEAELGAFITPFGQRTTGCFTCGCPTHTSAACEVACLPSDTDGFSGQLKISRLIERCIKTSQNKEGCIAQFDTEMGWLKTTRKYKGSDMRSAGAAADRWDRDLGQIQQAFQRALAAHSW